MDKLTYVNSDSYFEDNMLTLYNEPCESLIMSTLEEYYVEGANLCKAYDLDYVELFNEELC